MHSHINWNAAGPGPIRMLLWILGVPYPCLAGTRLTLTSKQRKYGLEVLNVLAKLSPLLDQVALGQLFIMCDCSKIVHALLKVAFTKYNPWTPPAAAPPLGAVDSACQLSYEQVRRIGAAVFAEGHQDVLLAIEDLVVSKDDACSSNSSDSEDSSSDTD